MSDTWPLDPDSEIGNDTAVPGLPEPAATDSTAPNAPLSPATNKPKDTLNMRKRMFRLTHRNRLANDLENRSCCSNDSLPPNNVPSRTECQISDYGSGFGFRRRRKPIR